MRASSNRVFSRKAGFVMTASLALASSCSSVSAQDHGSWRCNTPNGHYRENASPISSTVTSISGRITYHKPYFGTNFGSTAKIAFQDSKLDGSSCHCNGILLQAYPNSDFVGYFMIVDGQKVAMHPRQFDIPITFNISVSPQGLMTVRIGKTNLDINTVILPHPERDVIRMVCSGADVTFHDIEAR